MILAIAAISIFGQSKAPKELVDQASRAVQIVFGLKFGSGPVWTPSGRLLWSDVAGDSVYELRNGKPMTLISPSQRASGHTYDAEGRLLSCLTGGRRVIRQEADGKTTSLASSYEGRKLNGPANVVVRSDGTTYFTDPGIAMTSRSELGFYGVYRISPDGKLQVEIKDFAMPNGLAFTRNESQIYISDTIRHCIRVFDVAKDGSLSNGKIFVYLTGELEGAADGIKVDTKGNVYCAGPGGVQIFNSAAKYQGLIFVRDAVTDFCFGDADRKTLYITAAHGIYKIRVKVAG